MSRLQPAGSPGRVRAVSSAARSAMQVALAVAPRLPGTGPSGADDVTADFVTNVIGASVAGARCGSVARLESDEGTTNRSRMLLDWNEAGLSADLPPTVFVKSTPLRTLSRIMVAPIDMAVTEVRFYRDLRPRLDVSAPTSWYGSSAPGGRHLLVLEDLAAADCRFHDLGEECSLEHAQAVMHAQASLHATMWDLPRRRRDLRWIRTWSRRPGYAFLRSIYKLGRATVLASDRPEVTPAVRRLCRAMNRHPDTLYRAFEQGPLTVLHGDPHLGNTYSLPNGDAGFVDWQFVWHGPGLRDVAYFLHNSVGVELRRQHGTQLLRLYLDELEARGVEAPDFNTAFDLVRLFTGELVDALGIMLRWPGFQPDDYMDAAARRVCAAVEDLGIAEHVETVAAN